MSGASSFGVVRGSVDLTGCDKEPVHRLGTIQNHGALLAFDRGSEVLVEGSSNWSDFFPDLARSERTLTLDQLFAPEVVAELRTVEALDRQICLPHTLACGAEISAHLTEALLVVELEAVAGTAEFDPVSGLNDILSALSREQSSSAYLETLAARLRLQLSVQRVMIYRFHPDWTGEVVAESCLGAQRYLGLRFPASDIPRPAREIFEKVWVRNIADVEQPSLPVMGPQEQPCSFDMTHSSLRASSPIHLEYLRNMGVAASLTCSLRVEDALWGLVAIHHNEPYRLRPSARSGLELLSQMASFQLAQRLSSETKLERKRCESRLADLRERWETDEMIRLSEGLTSLANLIESDALAVYENGAWSGWGGAGQDQLHSLRHWLVTNKNEDTDRLFFHSVTLPSELKLDLAGALVVGPSGPSGSLVCWFRGEQTQSVRWAGVPKTKDVPTPFTRLEPRSSFAEYVEVTKHKSLPWTELDLWKADQLLNSFRNVQLRFNRRLEQRNDALNRSNLELDTFAYMASHDLKEPLRGIANYATFLREDYGDQLTGDGTVYLDGLQGLAERMTSLVDSLLTYSRLNHQKLDITECDLTEMAKEAARIIELTRGARVNIRSPLPVVEAYAPFLAEILMNLLTNAVKYSDDSDREIEIASMPSSRSGWTFYVKDNGIGIPAEHHESIFHLFRRLHGDDARGGGSGVGLTIVKRMVERHGGRLRLESEPGRGTSFYVFLPRSGDGSTSQTSEQVVQGLRRDGFDQAGIDAGPSPSP